MILGLCGCTKAQGCSLSATQDRGDTCVKVSVCLMLSSADWIQQICTQRWLGKALCNALWKESDDILTPLDYNLTFSLLFFSGKSWSILLGLCWPMDEDEIMWMRASLAASRTCSWAKSHLNGLGASSARGWPSVINLRGASTVWERTLDSDQERTPGKQIIPALCSVWQTAALYRSRSVCSRVWPRAAHVFAVAHAG